MRILGLDLGTKTLGIAVCDVNEIVASGLENFTYKPGEFNACYDKIISIVNEKQIGEIVIGMPFNMNGSAGEKVEFVKKFIDGLKKLIKINIVEYDERWTTKLATNYLLQADLSRNKRKQVIDKMSAVVILQDYLNQKGLKK